MSWGDHQHQRMVDMILEPGVWIQGSPICVECWNRHRVYIVFLLCDVMIGVI